ncbi:MAG: MoaD/ThiS family protein [Rhodobacteraceae bacterium]|nr:MoaD/ThiS family protein [Paracoccaceae bacterium]
MVKVTIWGSLRAATDGAAEVEVEAQNFKQVMSELERNYPGLQAQIAAGASLAIDGKIYREAWFTPVYPDSEVVLMPFMVGG